jgi:hypothetical protein
MKKLAALMVVATMVLSAPMVKAGAGETILLYIPNRLVDMVDMFSLTLGFGPAIGAEVQVTESCALGGEVGCTAQIVKGINRQYGFAVDNGWDASFLMVSAETRERQDSIGSVKDYYFHSTGVPTPNREEPYDFHSGQLDFWAIGAKAAALVEVKVDIHPVEIADFILGWLFIDIKDDDFGRDNIDM